jgi:hypothetical protein
MPKRTAERPPLSPAVRETFNHWKRGDLFDSLEASYRQLLDRRKNVVEVERKPISTLRDPNRIRRRLPRSQHADVNPEDLGS